MSDSLSSFAALFRAVLMLHGEGSAGVENLIAFVQTAKLFRLDPTPFERIFEFRASDRLPTSEKEAHEIFSSLHVPDRAGS